MTQNNTTPTLTASEMYAAYEDQVVAVSEAWQQYQNLLAQYERANKNAMVAREEAQSAHASADGLWHKTAQAFDVWDKASKRRLELHDAYWARYDQVAA